MKDINKYKPIASAEEFLQKVASSINNLKGILPQEKETVAVTANEDEGVFKK